MDKTASQTAPEKAPIVRLKSISKSFAHVQANKDITLDIHAGSILALLGENGAGKSTLMSILAGRFEPDSGSILIDGAPTHFASPKDAIKAGIGMVYQHFALVERMSVAENVLLGQEGGFFLRPRRMRDAVAGLAVGFGLPVDPDRSVRGLSMGERQRVEILKLLFRQSRVLILDEPTAALTPVETEQLFAALRAMAARGKAIVFISHKLPEVMSIANEIAILRAGRIEGRFSREDVPSQAELARRMVGREVLLDVDKPHLPAGERVLEVEGLSGGTLDNVSLGIDEGEIVAIVGVAGNGQKELVETICGLSEPASGRVVILGRPWREFFADPSWRRSLGYIPEDRLGLAALPGSDLVDNVLLTTRQGFSRGPLLDRREAATVTDRLMREFDVRPARRETLAWQLSGGNLQKLVLARELFRESRLIVAEQPTQGLDIASTEDVWRHIIAARKHAGILLVTGDLTEALSLADRIAVMFKGGFMDIFPATDKAKVDGIGLMMAGIAPGQDRG